MNISYFLNSAVFFNRIAAQRTFASPRESRIRFPAGAFLLGRGNFPGEIPYIKNGGESHSGWNAAKGVITFPCVVFDAFNAQRVVRPLETIVSMAGSGWVFRYLENTKESHQESTRRPPITLNSFPCKVASSILEEIVLHRVLFCRLGLEPALPA